MEFAFIAILILANGAFAMSELALVSARKGRLRRLADEGDRRAQLAIELGEDPTRFLSAIQIGITSIGVLSGIIGESVLAEPFSVWLEARGLSTQAAEITATAAVVLGLTYLTIVFGELVPKRFGQIRADSVARLVAGPIEVLAIVTKPFVRLLSVSTDLVLRLLPGRAASGAELIAEEIQALLEEGQHAGVIDPQERAIVRNAFRLDERLAGSLMTPRSDIVFLDADEPEAENLRRVVDAGHAWFPVVRGGPDEVVGLVSTTALLGQVVRGQPLELAGTTLRAPVFVPEALTGAELLETFRAAHVPLVLVVDEYGQVEGLVTLQSLLEALTGELPSATPEEAWAVRRADGSWLLDGLIPVPELKDRLGLAAVPEEEAAGYHTLAGMLMLLHGRLPRTADRTEWGGWTFEIVDMDGNRIDKVLAVPATPPPVDG
jgi:putative hemolysin